MILTLKSVTYKQTYTQRENQSLRLLIVLLYVCVKEVLGTPEYRLQCDHSCPLHQKQFLVLKKICWSVGGQVLVLVLVVMLVLVLVLVCLLVCLLICWWWTSGGGDQLQLPLNPGHGSDWLPASAYINQILTFTSLQNLFWLLIIQQTDFWPKLRFVNEKRRDFHFCCNPLHLFKSKTQNLECTDGKQNRVQRKFIGSQQTCSKVKHQWPI